MTTATRVRGPEVGRRRWAAVLARRNGVTPAGVLAAVAVLALLVCGGLVWAPTASAAGCAAGSSVDVVAHPDDDLFFINPSILHDIQAGVCSTTVFATSGDSGDTSGYYQNRESGILAAYATMAGVANSWSSARVTYAGHAVTQLTLTPKPTVQVVFMRLPDGNIDGSGFASTGYATLRKLYEGTIATLPTVDTPRQTYTLQQIVDTLGAIMTSAGATVVRTLDNVHDYGQGDHSDHLTIARLATSARNQAAPGASLTGYYGYPGAGLPANVSGADLTAKIAAFQAYAPFDWNMCLTYSDCVADGRPEPLWLQRSNLVSQSAGSSDPGNGTGTGGQNVAGAASVTASSQNTGTGQLATKAVDGKIDGYPGDYTAEWATAGGGAGSWLQLTWSNPVQLDRVVLYDRPNPNDQITAGTLTFSDGSTVAVPTLANDGSATPVSFAARTTTSLRLTVTSVSATSENVGLAELQAWTPNVSSPPTSTPPTTPPTTTPPTTTSPTTTAPTTPPATPVNVAGAASVTASSQNTGTGQLATKAVDGKIDGYPGDYTAEWATAGGGAGSWLQLTWSNPVQLDRVVLYDRPNPNDQITAGTLTFSDGSTVAVPTLANDGSATPVSFAARTTTSLRLTVTSVSATSENVGLAELQAWTPGGTASPTATTTPTVTPTTTPPTTTTPPRTTPPTTTPPATTTATGTSAPGTTNLAPSAAVTASSQNTTTGQLATRAVDGAIGGYPNSPTAEWATAGGGAGSWLQLTWSSAVTVGRVVLYDRPNLNDRVMSAIITFSDGTTVTVGALDNAGGATTVTFPVRSTATLRITITSVSSTTENVGLAELQVYAA